MASNSSFLFSNYPHTIFNNKNTPNPTPFPRNSPSNSPSSIQFPSLSFKPSLHSHLIPSSHLEHINNSGSNNNGNNNNNNNFWGRRWWGNDDSNHSVFPPLLFFFLHQNENSNSTPRGALIFLVSVLICLWNSKLDSAFALDDNNKGEAVWEVRGGKWTKLLPNQDNDDFDVIGASRFANGDTHESMLMNSGLNLWSRCRDLFLQLMLPDGYPNSVSSDFLEYSLWRGVQGVASQVSAVLATQALLYAIGLGKGAIPTAAAINWVLKDGIGYLSKIFLSKYGRHFDVNPKGWRLFADLLENAAFGLEILTPAFPHLFVYIGAVAGAGRSAATLIQAATRSCFFAGFAAQRNFAEVIAKGEAQGMVSKSIGIMLGIALANWVGTSTPLALTTFAAVTVIHMYTNLKSYQAILLKTLNPYRASLVFSEYLLSGEVPRIKEVNDEEPIFAVMPLINASLKGETQSQLLSSEAKTAAAEIEQRLQLGSKLSDTVTSKNDAGALFDLYRNEGYLLTEHRGKYCVVLKEGYSPQDMLKSLFHVNYLYWLEKNVGIETKGAENDCKAGGKLRISLDYVQREFEHVKRDGSLAGWVLDGLVARPSPCRVREGSALVSAPVS